eukprot:5100882-Alexandrium_andersonii.AAC.1
MQTGRSGNGACFGRPPSSPLRQQQTSPSYDSPSRSLLRFFPEGDSDARRREEDLHPGSWLPQWGPLDSHCNGGKSHGRGSGSHGDGRRR